MPIINIELSPGAIEELRLIWKEEFGEEISYEQAEIRGKELIRLFNIIYRPLPIRNHSMRDKERKGDLPHEAKSAKKDKLSPEPKGTKGQLKLL